MQEGAGTIQKAYLSCCKRKREFQLSEYEGILFFLKPEPQKETTEKLLLLHEVWIHSLARK